MLCNNDGAPAFIMMVLIAGVRRMFLPQKKNALIGNNKANVSYEKKPGLWLNNNILNEP